MSPRESTYVVYKSLDDVSMIQIGCEHDGQSWISNYFHRLVVASVDWALLLLRYPLAVLTPVVEYKKSRLMTKCDKHPPVSKE